MKTALKRHRILLVSAMLGLSAALFSGMTVSNYVKTKPVVVAARDLVPHEKIRRSDVKLVQMPVKAVHPASLPLEQVVGGFSATYLVAGQQVLKGHVRFGINEAGLSFDLPSGWRGMFIPVTPERCLGGEVRAGEKIDVIFCPKASYSQPERRGVTVLRDVVVLEVKRAKDTGEFAGVMALLSPEACEILAGCLESGNVYVSLVPRNEAPDAGEGEGSGP
ncbi:MAG: hypothetical protein IMW97_02500 [Firmicutes bacterium]|nr:hypothetical protein [Candidatus Fermentithermobacillaceae bacterium]